MPAAPLDSAVERPDRARVRFRGTWAEIDLEALAKNLLFVRKRAPGAKVLAVVKANAYGHGAVVCARRLEAEGVDMFGVALIEEGIELRRAGIASTIIVLGARIEADPKAILEHRLVPVIYDARSVELLAKTNRGPGRVPITIKLDTGLTRLGTLPEELPHLLSLIARTKEVELVGFMSHFANADLADPDKMAEQKRIFQRALLELEGFGLRPAWVHISNSAAVMRAPDAHHTVVRPGIVLYGIDPSSHRPRDPASSGQSPSGDLSADLCPVLSWRTTVIRLRPVPRGTAISYGGRFVTARPSQIATLAVGYADGYVRALSPGAEVLVAGNRAPIVGTICMDLCMADVTDIPEASEGGVVTLLGRDGDEEISADELAVVARTIPYEILCGISARVPRMTGV